jgi:hypothetical protein
MRAQVRVSAEQSDAQVAALRLQRRRALAAVTIVAVPVLTALLLRLPFMDWALPDLLYPDEAAVLQIAAKTEGDHLDFPHWPNGDPFYEYGHLGLTITRSAVRSSTREAISSGAAYADERPEPWRFAPGARRLTLVFALAVVALAVATGWVLVSPAVGAGAGAITAVAAIHFRYSLWAKPDMIVAAFGAASLLLAVLAAERRRPGTAVFAAALGGGATAAKYNGGIAMAGACLAAVLAGSGWRGRLQWTAAALVAGGAGFFAGMPTALTHWGEFWTTIQVRFIHGGQIEAFGPAPPLGGPIGTLRIMGSTLLHTFWCGKPSTGPPNSCGTDLWAGGVFVAAVITGALVAGRRRRRGDVVVLATAAATIVLMFPWLRRGFSHQLLPILPAIAALAALGAAAWLRNLRRPGRAWTTAVAALVLVVVPLGRAAADDLRFASAIDNRDYRSQADWLLTHVPFGSRIAAETYVGPLPDAAYDLYRAFTLSLNPVSFYRDSGYEYVAVSDEVKLRYSGDPKTRGFYGELERSSVLLFRFASQHNPFRAPAEIRRLRGVRPRLPGAAVPGRGILANTSFETGTGGWLVSQGVSGGRSTVDHFSRVTRAEGRTGSAVSLAVRGRGRAVLRQAVYGLSATAGAWVRSEGNINAWLQVKTYTRTGAHVGTARYRIAGKCDCRSGAGGPPGRWRSLDAVLPEPILEPPSGATGPLLVELAFVVEGCERCDGRLLVDDVSLGG